MVELEYPSIMDASEPVSKAINEIARTGLPVIITKKGKYLGMIDVRAIRMHVDPSKLKCESLAEKAPTLAPQSTIVDACRAFFAGSFKAIPVIDKGKIIGAITRRTLFQELLKEKALTKKRVSDAMTSPVHSLDVSATIGQARSEMRKYGIRRLVITKDGKIYGLLSLFDLATSLSGKVHSSHLYLGKEKTGVDSLPILPHVKKQVETIGASESLSSAVKKMFDNKVAALIVEDENYPCGIITAKDILHLAIAEQKGSQKVFISGLGHDEKEYSPLVMEMGEKLLSKIGKSMSIRSLAFHIKSEGSGFSVRGRLDTGTRAYSASAFAFRLESAVKKTCDEIERMARKDKPSGMRRMGEAFRERE